MRLSLCSYIKLLLYMNLLTLPSKLLHFQRLCAEPGFMSSDASGWQGASGMWPLTLRLPRFSSAVRCLHKKTTTVRHNCSALQSQSHVKSYNNVAVVKWSLCGVWHQAPAAATGLGMPLPRRLLQLRLERILDGRRLHQR
jgi:hypothetical protein